MSDRDDVSLKSSEIMNFSMTFKMLKGTNGEQFHAWASSPKTPSSPSILPCRRWRSTARDPFTNRQHQNGANMSDNTYHMVEVDLSDAEELKPDVHLEVAGVKLDLPNLNNAELPIELVQAILLVKSKPMLSDEETTACVSTFLAYFQTMQPNFWNVLRKTKRPMAYLTATIKAWADESGLDQKRLPRPPLEQQSRGTSLRLDPSVRADLQAYASGNGLKANVHESIGDSPGR